MKNKRNYSIDILRVLATFLVIVNHTNSTIFLENSPSKTSFLSLFYLSLSKIAVGIIFLISGSLLLTKHETIMETYKKRLILMIL